MTQTAIDVRWFNVRYKETAMFAIHSHRRIAQRAICLFFAAVIVSSGLSLGAFGALAMERSAAAAVTEARV